MRYRKGVQELLFRLQMWEEDPVVPEGFRNSERNFTLARMAKLVGAWMSSFRRVSLYAAPSSGRGRGGTETSVKNPETRGPGRE